MRGSSLGLSLETVRLVLDSDCADLDNHIRCLCSIDENIDIEVHIDTYILIYILYIQTIRLSYTYYTYKQYMYSDKQADIDAYS